MHGVPQLGAGCFDIDHIALHVITRSINLLHALLQLRACALVFAEVGLQLVAKRDDAQEFLGLKQIALFAWVQVIQVPAHVLYGFKGRAVFHTRKIALH